MDLELFYSFALVLNERPGGKGTVAPCDDTRTSLLEFARAEKQNRLTKNAGGGGGYRLL